MFWVDARMAKQRGLDRHDMGHLRGNRNAWKILMGKREGKRLFLSRRHTGKDNIKIDLTAVVWEVMFWIRVAQDRQMAGFCKCCDKPAMFFLSGCLPSGGFGFCSAFEFQARDWQKFRLFSKTHCIAICSCIPLPVRIIRCQ